MKHHTRHSQERCYIMQSSVPSHLSILRYRLFSKASLSPVQMGFLFLMWAICSRSSLLHADFLIVIRSQRPLKVAQMDSSAAYGHHMCPPQLLCSQTPISKNLPPLHNCHSSATLLISPTVLFALSLNDI